MGEPGDRIIEAQVAYYDARADEYDATFRGAHDPELVARLRAARPAGRVLELACGTGAWTRSLLVPAVTALTCLDAAPRMLAIHERRIEDPRVTRARVDLFAWTPDARHDVVTFAFWLSHVPPARFAEFWGTVRAALAEGGRVIFVDEDDRGEAWELPGGDPAYPTVDRRLRDGRTMTAIKVYHSTTALEEALTALGWSARVEPVGERFLFGEARPAT